uniref:Uncharacterized protein n=1 Tax=Arundo donax TaxID=35708 RepID=A0A0A9H2U8_ARUDO
MIGSDDIKLALRLKTSSKSLASGLYLHTLRCARI